MKKIQIKKIANYVMRLSWFANRFGKSGHDVSWCIIQSDNEDGDVTVTPAVYVGDDLYIDILADELKCLINVGGCSSIVLSATVKRSSDSYLFETVKGSWRVEKSQIYNVYRSKFIYPEKIVEAKCLNS